MYVFTFKHNLSQSPPPPKIKKIKSNHRFLRLCLDLGQSLMFASTLWDNAHIIQEYVKHIDHVHIQWRAVCHTYANPLVQVVYLDRDQGYIQGRR